MASGCPMCVSAPVQKEALERPSTAEGFSATSLRPSAWLSLGRMHLCRACLRFTRTHLDAHRRPPGAGVRDEVGAGELRKSIAEPLVVHAKPLAQRTARQRLTRSGKHFEDAGTEIGPLVGMAVGVTRPGSQRDRVVAWSGDEIEHHRIQRSSGTMLDGECAISGVSPTRLTNPDGGTKCEAHGDPPPWASLLAGGRSWPRILLRGCDPAIKPADLRPRQRVSVADPADTERATGTLDPRHCACTATPSTRVAPLDSTWPTDIVHRRYESPSDGTFSCSSRAWLTCLRFYLPPCSFL